LRGHGDRDGIVLNFLRRHSERTQQRQHIESAAARVSVGKTRYQAGAGGDVTQPFCTTTARSRVSQSVLPLSRPFVVEGTSSALNGGPREVERAFIKTAARLRARSVK